jgi:dTDP-4-dehydrorhamnose 3,5-epimerase
VKLLPLRLRGAFIVQPEVKSDVRGWFARTWCARDFAAEGLAVNFVQANLSLSRRPGTLRGLHYQTPPHEEAKLVQCSKGHIYDVIVDMRTGSPTQWQWEAVDLRSEELRLLFVPVGFAHGYQTLVPDTEVTYQMGEYYVQEAAAGLRWNDPVLNISWPMRDPILSDRDRTFTLLSPP